MSDLSNETSLLVVILKNLMNNFMLNAIDLNYDY